MDKVSVCFFGRQVLQDITTDFKRQQITVLVGRSGSGKTTLLRSINRLNEEFDGCVTRGQVVLNIQQKRYAVYPLTHEPRPDEPLLHSLKLTFLRQRVGMLFQTPNIFPVTVYKNIALPLTLVGQCAKTEIQERVRQALQLDPL